MKISREEKERRKQEDLNFYKSVYIAYVTSSRDDLGGGKVIAHQGHLAAIDAVKYLQDQRGVIDNS